MRGWVFRSDISHRQDVGKLSQCRSKSARQRMEKSLGCRYSSLLDLPYFDAPTMLVIDPMHCLFLDIAKHFLKRVFLVHGILSEQDLRIIQNQVNAICFPSDIGRIPHKIEHAFYSFTADQYKNWVMHYSIICLHGLLSSEILECWRHFVLACRYICQPVLSQNDVVIGDALLVKFCSRSEALFGKSIITPNMHMSCHLKECVLDYGPLNNFWLFAFERFNGTLGKLPNNNQSIETQMMKRFISDTNMFRAPLPDDFKSDFTKVLSFHHSPVGNLDLDTSQSSMEKLESVTIPHNSIRSTFNLSEIESLNQLISFLYPQKDIQIASTFHKYKMLQIRGKVYGSYRSRSRSSSIVFAVLRSETRPTRINDNRWSIFTCHSCLP